MNLLYSLTNTINALTNPITAGTNVTGFKLPAIETAITIINKNNAIPGLVLTNLYIKNNIKSWIIKTTTPNIKSVTPKNIARVENNDSISSIFYHLCFLYHANVKIPTPNNPTITIIKLSLVIGIGGGTGGTTHSGLDAGSPKSHLPSFAVHVL